MPINPCDPCGTCIPGNIDDALFHQMALAALCNILAAIQGGGGGGENVNVASWGGVATSLGQKAMAASVPVVIASDQSAVPISGTVTTAPATTGTLANTFTSTSGAGSTTANIYSVVIVNTGGVAGTLGGLAFAAGEKFTETAILDPVTNVFKKVPAIAYDATGTTYTIIEVA